MRKTQTENNYTLFRIGCQQFDIFYTDIYCNKKIDIYSSKELTANLNCFKKYLFTKLITNSTVVFGSTENLQRVTIGFHEN